MVTLNDAKKIIGAAKKKAAAIGQPVNIAVADVGGAYGYVDMGGWIGGHAEYVVVPYADFNLLKFPDKAQAMEKIQHLTCLTDILPTGYDGCVNAGVTTGSTVLVSWGWPQPRPRSCWAPRSSSSPTSTINKERLVQAASFGCETDRSVTRRHAGRATRADPQSTRSGLLGRLRGF